MASSQESLKLFEESLKTAIEGWGITGSSNQEILGVILVGGGEWGLGGGWWVLGG